VRPQVVNVPVGPAAWHQMMREPGAETARAVGAADVDVESWLEAQTAKPPDVDGRSGGRCEHEGVGSGLGIYQHCQASPSNQ